MTKWFGKINVHQNLHLPFLSFMVKNNFLNNVQNLSHKCHHMFTILIGQKKSN